MIKLVLIHSENALFTTKSHLQFLSTCDETFCEAIYKHFDLHNGNIMVPIFLIRKLSFWRGNELSMAVQLI